MRKIITLLLCLVMVAAMTVTVFATDSATMSFRASSSTVHRGDTVTITVSLSSVEDCRSAGFAHSFNTSVFEFVSGSCTLSGVAMGSVNSSAASFAYGSGTAVSGQVFTYTLKVKDDAPYGTYSVSGTANVRDTNGSISTSVSAASITVACDHSYGSWTNADTNNHQKVCGKCGDIQTASHTWNSGTITKQPSCKETGTKTFACTACNATKTETIDKTTNHSYGAWTKVNDATHKSTCSVCSDVKTASHNWNSGTITKQPTCKDTGIKTYTCTDCGATKTEDVAKTTNHNYGSWTKVDGSNHKHTCSVCQKEETASHSWNSGAITKHPTCKEVGVKTYTCTACNTTKTEDISKTNEHSYSSWVKVNDSTHKHTCSVCGKEETASHSWNNGTVTKQPTCKDSGVKTFTCTVCGGTKTESISKLTTHTYDHACDTDCNVCGVTRTTTHSYKSTWSKDASGHWHECSVCKNKKDTAAHTPGAEATETQAQTCTACGYVIKAALGHKHSYASSYTTDVKGHWYKCSGCEEKGSYTAHDFENACDKDCSVCGYSRETKHTYAESWKNSKTIHWHECTGCGLKADEEVHTPGAAATETTAQTCTICGYVIAPATGSNEPTEEPTEPSEYTDTQPTENTQSSEENNSGTEFPWWIIVLVAVCGVAIIAVVVWKKKTK